MNNQRSFTFSSLAIALTVVRVTPNCVSLERNLTNRFSFEAPINTPPYFVYI